MRDRLLTLHDGAADAVREAGRNWYPSAEGAIATLANAYGVGRPTAAGVVAALSPQTRWRKNLEGAEAVLNGEPWRATGYGSNVAKAERIAAGSSPLLVLGGDKVRSFWANLVGSRATLTIDVWAQRAATGRDLAPPKGNRYRRIARAYEAAAAAVGEHPRDLQAICWLAIRPAAEHDRDVRYLLGLEAA